MKEYFAFQWHITDDCDQRCKHCYIFSENNCKEPDSVTWEQMEEVVANCEDFCEIYNSLPYFYITGGDPILHPDFWRLLGLLKSRDILFTILGNPFHLKDKVCQRLKEHGCQKYQLSLDGMQKTHDWFRKPGSFEITLEKISCLKRAGIRAVIMNLRSDGSFVEDEEWHEAAGRYEDFLRIRKNKHILFLELGVGYNTPGIIKYPFRQMTAANPKAIYACINYGETGCPHEIEKRSICIDGDIGKVFSCFL